MEPTKFFLPPGFRFHPTDEELIVHYLVKKSEQGSGVPIIAEVDLYKYNPWDLPAKAHVGEQEWYFLTPRDRKYPNGSRPNRAAASGYWKATGTDKPIFKKSSGAKVGIKKALVFYEGKAPRGVKTEWIMHEYRLATNDGKASGYDGGRKSLRMDDWVLCRIYKKAVSANKAMKMNDFTRNGFESSYEIAEPSGIEDSIDSFISTLSDQRLDFEEGTGCYQSDSSFPEHLMSSDCVINELEKVFLKRQDLYPQSSVKTPRFRLDSTPSKHHGMRII